MTVPLVDARPLQAIDERMAELLRQRDELLTALKSTRTQAYRAIVASGTDPEFAALAVAGADAAIANVERTK